MTIRRPFALAGALAFCFGLTLGSVARAEAAEPLAVASSAASAAMDSPPLTVLTLGGGPNFSHNQVAIESNVRYLCGLLPSRVDHTILFADGDPNDRTVEYSADGRKLSKEEQVFRVLFRQDPDTTLTRFRVPDLPKIDGPSNHKSYHEAIGKIAALPPSSPALLYFTGHGSPTQGNLDNNQYDLWNDGGLTVKELSAEIARLPKGRPVTVIMVQCFSGAFGNLLFTGGDPKGELIDRPICGFFATTQDRVAAGCTPEVNEKYYRDFTSYFFAALTGRDRLGHRVPPPDYNNDGKVGMDEAWAYALVTSPSIDVPVPTSDIFLRRFAALTDAELGGATWQHVHDIASPAQKIALDGLTHALGDDSPDRIKTALATVQAMWQEQQQEQQAMQARQAARRNRQTPPNEQRAAPLNLPPEMQAAVSTLRQWRERLILQFPGLSQGLQTPEFAPAERSALEYLKENPAVEDAILKARDTQMARMQQMQQPAVSNPLDMPAQVAGEQADRGVISLRLVRVVKSVLLEEKLRTGGDTLRIVQFDKLKRLEAGNPFSGL